jgi:TetR/AcrR family transcriptional regulator, transcriptional repressor for nem operon
MEKMSRGAETRRRILDAAQEPILQKGFEATSIDEIVADANITKSGFFYHFPDKNALAIALIERHIEVEDRMFDEIFDRARELSDDPLHCLLIGLRLLAELIEDLPNGHPGCIVATAAYQDRLFNQEVRDANRRAVLNWRDRFRGYFEQILETYELSDDVGIDMLADMVSSILEGGLMMARAMDDPRVTAQQILMLRSYLKLLFRPKRA